jgi:hypothetical protein
MVCFISVLILIFKGPRGLGVCLSTQGFRGFQGFEPYSGHDNHSSYGITTGSFQETGSKMINISCSNMFRNQAETNMFKLIFCL